MSALRFFELLEHVGVAADGSLEPLVHTAVRKVKPVMRGDQVVFVEETVLLKPVGSSEADARTTATADSTIAEHLLTNGCWREVDPTTPVQKRRRTAAASQAQEA